MTCITFTRDRTRRNLKNLKIAVLTPFKSFIVLHCRSDINVFYSYYFPYELIACHYKVELSLNRE